MSPLQQCQKCGTFQASAVEGGICNTCRIADGETLKCDEASAPNSRSTVADTSPGTSGPVGPQALFQFKNYEVLTEIARGGMGIVFKARQIRLNRLVALKVIRSGQIAGPAEIQRFLIEAKAAATLQHPNIVAIHEIGEEAGQHFFSMDLVEGSNLADFVQTQALAPRDAAMFVRSIAEAIHYAHQRGILHRDLKPSNVLIDKNNQPRITDFGLAKLMTDESEITQAGVVMGSPSYMPPEQAEGRTQDVTVRSDIYSLGAILYQLLTSRPPFSAESPLATLKMVLEKDPISPRQLQPGIPRDLDTICLKCLEKDPAKRFGTAQEVADELRRFLSHQPIHSRPLGPMGRTLRWCRRKPAVATALLIFICGFIGVYGQWRRAEALAVNESGLRHRAELASVEALLAQARVLRSSGTAGQRHGSLAALEKAARLRPSPEIRDEILACLPLMDLRLASHWEAKAAPSSLFAFNQELSRYACCESSNRVRISSTGHNESIRTVPSLASPITMLQFSPNGKLLAVASTGGFVVWNVDSDQPQFQITNLTGAVVVQFAADNSRIATGDGTGRIAIYSINSGHRDVAFDIGRACGCIRFNATGSRLAVSSRESLNLFVFDTVTGEEKSRLPHPGVLNDLAWNATGAFIATACADNQVYIWDTNGVALTVLRGHTAAPQRVAFANTGSFLASLGEDKTLVIWDASSGHPLVRWDGVSTEVLKFSADDRQLACRAYEPGLSQLQLLEVTWPEDIRFISEKAPAHDINVLAENGRLLILPAQEGLHLWDITTGQQLESIRMGAVQGIALTAEGSDLLVRDFYGTHRLPMAHTSVHGAMLLVGPPFFFDCPSGEGAMAAAGTNTLAVCQNDRIALLAIETGEVLRTLTAWPGLKSLAASPDGNWIAAYNSEMGQTTIWNSADGTILTNLPTTGRIIVSFSGDSKWLTTANESVCDLWSTNDWKLRRTLRRLRLGAMPALLSFSPDASMIAWASSDNTVTLTDVETGDTLLSLPSPGHGIITALQFTPGGGGLLISAEGWPLAVWNLGAIQKKLDRFGVAFNTARTLPPGWPETRDPLPLVIANVAKMEQTQRARQDLRDCRKAVANDPHDFSAWREIASINSSLYRFAPAVEAYTQALRLKPEESSCAMEAAYALMKLKRFREAEEQYKHILIEDPEHPGANLQLAYLYLHALKPNLDVTKGHLYAEKALRLDPKNSAAIFWLAVAEYRLGNFKQALELVDRAISASPTTQTYLFYQSMCLARLGQSREAADTLNKALDRLFANGASLVEHREHFQSFIDEARGVCLQAQTHE